MAVISMGFISVHQSKLQDRRLVKYPYGSSSILKPGSLIKKILTGPGSYFQAAIAKGTRSKTSIKFIKRLNAILS